MTLRTKTIHIIAITMVLLIVILYGITLSIVQSGFTKVETELTGGFWSIENADMRRNVAQASDVLSYRIRDLSVKAADWAMWDDLYRFVVDHNHAFEKSNLSTDALAALKLNMIIMVNTSGKIVYESNYDFVNKKVCPVPQAMNELLLSNPSLLHHDSTQSVHSGIVMLPDNPVMLVSLPIVRSDATGPIRGTLFFVRVLDSAEISQFSTMTHLAISLYRLDATALCTWENQVLASLNDTHPIIIVLNNNDSICGYTEIRDMQGRHGLLMRVDAPRNIYKQELQSLRDMRKNRHATLISLIVSIAAMGLILGFVILATLERSVLVRLRKLTDKTVAIGTSGNFNGSISDSGNDEIATLAQSINAMLKALSSTHAQINDVNAELQLIMNAIPVGLILLNEQFITNQQYSKAAAEILGNAALAQERFVDILGLGGERAKEGKELTDFLEFYLQRYFPEEDMAALNPLPELLYDKNGVHRILHIRYFAVHAVAGASRILAVIEDVTEERLLAGKVARSQRENFQLKAMVENPELFREFLVEIRRTVTQIERLAADIDKTDSCGDMVNDMFRNAHTVKGISSGFGLSDLSESASALEDVLSHVHTTGSHNTPTPQECKDIRSCVSQLARTVGLIFENARKIFGNDIERDNGIMLRIPADCIRNHIAQINSLSLGEALSDPKAQELREESVQRFKSLLLVPAKKGFARAVKIVPGLAQRLGKNIAFTFIGEDTLLDCQLAAELNAPVIHLLRNALDHGVENPLDRIRNGKQEKAAVSLIIEKTERLVTVSISDDGRGIDTEQLKLAAIKKQLFSAEQLAKMSSAELISLIFIPGFTTTDTISDVSGRGVGMDAVMTSVKYSLNGDVRIDTVAGSGTKISLVIPV